MPLPCSAPLRVLAAPNAFKGSLPAPQAAGAIAAGAGRAPLPVRVRQLPMADGGDGTAAVLAATLGGTAHTRTVRDAWGRPHRAAFIVLPDGSAVVELAAACGLGPRRPDPAESLAASSFGAGELALAALAHGCHHVFLALGGSASTDGGAGLLAALGARLADASGQPPPDGGRGLAALARVDLSGLPWRGAAPLSALVDVDNPLLGERGTARAFAPQKGADPPAQAVLEGGLAHWAGILEHAAGRSAQRVPGSGAAGGVGFALAALDVPLRPGGEEVAKLIGLDAALAEADLVLTGEGALDATTEGGKAPAVVARHAATHRVAVVGIAGQLGPQWERLLGPPAGFAACLALGSGPRPRRQALAATARDLEIAAETAVRVFAAGRASHTAAAAGSSPQGGEAAN